MLPCVVLASSLPARGALPRALRVPVRGVGSGLESMQKETVFRLVILATSYLWGTPTISCHSTGIKDLFSMNRRRRRRGDIAGWLGRWPADCPLRGSVLLGCGRECVPARPPVEERNRDESRTPHCTGPSRSERVSSSPMVDQGTDGANCLTRMGGLGPGRQRAGQWRLAGKPASLQGGSIRVVPIPEPGRVTPRWY